jgi:DNA-binding transcriptional ArsR family regulator
MGDGATNGDGHPSGDPAATSLDAGLAGKEIMGGEDPSQDRQAFDHDLAKALAHPLRVRILGALQGRTASPVQLSRELREPLGNVSYHSQELMAVGCVEEVGTRPKRGVIEHFYTARPRSFIGHQDWRRVPPSVRAGVTGEALRTFVERAGEAIDAGTIDGREDTTLNWMPIAVDEQGWRETAEILERARREVEAVAAASRERLGTEPGIPVVTGLAAFEMPPTGEAAAEALERGSHAEEPEDTG